MATASIGAVLHYCVKGRDGIRQNLQGCINDTWKSMITFYDLHTVS